MPAATSSITTPRSATIARRSTRSRSHPWVDPDRIIIYGSSLGSTTAPLVAQGKKVAGIAVQGGGAVTYLERMINFDRLYLERSGKYRPDQIHEEMIRRIPFHVEYLVNRKTPGADRGASGPI